MPLSISPTPLRQKNKKTNNPVSVGAMQDPEVLWTIRISSYVWEHVLRCPLRAAGGELWSPLSQNVLYVDLHQLPLLPAQGHEGGPLPEVCMPDQTRPGCSPGLGKAAAGRATRRGVGVIPPSSPQPSDT